MEGVSVQGECLSREGVSVQGGVSIQGGGLYPGRGSLSRGVSIHGGSLPRGVSFRKTPSVDRQTPVKMLPCPKLRLRAVNIPTILTTNKRYVQESIPVG